jgi:type II secretory pathway component PulM
MAPTTLTTIVMILFAVGLVILTAYCYLGSWQPVVRRVPEQLSEAEIEAAMRQMRQAIDDYERGDRPL